VLYVSLVLLAELTALPAGHEENGSVSGLVGPELVAVVWGTTIGLSLAHWFAFRLAVRAFGAGPASRFDLEVALSQLAGAAAVAVVATVVVVVLPARLEHRSVQLALAVIIGGVGYLVARIAGRPRWPAVIFGVVALLLGLVVVALKILLIHD
jgi:hypothetical protein